VTFDIDANGIVNVSAKDRATNREQRITISGAGTLDKSEVERMVQDAERHAAEDAALRDKAETRNKADQLVYSVERMLKDLEGKVPAAEKSSIEAAIVKVKSAIESDDIDRIKAATEDLQQESYKLSEILYKQADAAGGGAETPGSNGYHPNGAAPGEQPKHDDVIDAEFKSE
jgi:molecular chaperone DnaK